MGAGGILIQRQITWGFSHFHGDWHEQIKLTLENYRMSSATTLLLSSVYVFLQNNMIYNFP